ncbi:MAG: hypothetical protein AAF664_20540, partial [Planctomycetota bacterium]
MAKKKSAKRSRKKADPEASQPEDDGFGAGIDVPRDEISDIDFDDDSGDAPAKKKPRRAKKKATKARRRKAEVREDDDAPSPVDTENDQVDFDDDDVGGRADDVEASDSDSGDEGESRRPRGRRERGDRDRGDRDDRYDRGGKGRRGRGGRGRGRRRRRGGGDYDAVDEDAPVTESSGILEMHPNGYGFLRMAETNYARERSDPFVPGTMIEKFGLRQGIFLKTMVQDSRRKHGPRVKEIVEVEGMEPEAYLEVKNFDTLTPIN